MGRNIIKLLKSDNTWDAFEADWRAQCESYGEDFDSFAEGTFSVVRDVIDNDGGDKIGVYAFCVDGVHVSMCQINVVGLPGYDSPVMRVRFLTLSPDYDFGDKTVDDYASALVSTLAGVLALSDSDGATGVKHIKFHLSSPADRQFFSALGEGLNKVDEFASVKTRGAWLYITKS